MNIRNNAQHLIIFNRIYVALNLPVLTGYFSSFFTRINADMYEKQISLRYLSATNNTNFYEYKIDTVYLSVFICAIRGKK